MQLVTSLFSVLRVFILFDNEGNDWREEQGKQADVDDRIDKHTYYNESGHNSDIGDTDDCKYSYPENSCNGQNVGEYNYIVGLKLLLS